MKQDLKPTEVRYTHKQTQLVLRVWERERWYNERDRERERDNVCRLDIHVVNLGVRCVEFKISPPFNSHNIY